MDTLDQPHDKYFKATFGTVNFASDFLSNYLPQDIVDMVDMNTLELKKGSYLDKELKEQFTDLLFKVNIKDRQGFICFLFEHKSYKDRMVIFQVLKYIIEIWEASIKADKKKRKEEELSATSDIELPIILPIVIYHGKDEWNIERSIGEMIPSYNELSASIKKSIPNFEYMLYDLSNWNEDDKGIKPETSMTIKTLSRARYATKDEALQLIIDSVSLINETKEKDITTYYVAISINYMLNVRDDIEEQDMENIAGKISKEGGELVMSVAERLKEEGKKEGKEEGKKEGIKLGKLEKAKESARVGIAKGYSTQVIIDITGLTEEQVEEIREEIAKG